jgi:hypothetical protein
MTPHRATCRAVDLGALRQLRSPTTLAKHQENHMQPRTRFATQPPNSGSLHVLDHMNKGTCHDVSEGNPH